MYVAYSFDRINETTYYTFNLVSMWGFRLWSVTIPVHGVRERPVLAAVMDDTYFWVTINLNLSKVQNGRVKARFTTDLAEYYYITFYVVKGGSIVETSTWRAYSPCLMTAAWRDILYIVQPLTLRDGTVIMAFRLAPVYPYVERLWEVYVPYPQNHRFRYQPEYEVHELDVFACVLQRHVTRFNVYVGEKGSLVMFVEWYDRVLPGTRRLVTVMVNPLGTLTVRKAPPEVPGIDYEVVNSSGGLSVKVLIDSRPAFVIDVPYNYYPIKVLEIRDHVLAIFKGSNGQLMLSAYSPNGTSLWSATLPVGDLQFVDIDIEPLSDNMVMIATTPFAWSVKEYGPYWVTYWPRYQTIAIFDIDTGSLIFCSGRLVQPYDLAYVYFVRDGYVAYEWWGLVWLTSAYFVKIFHRIQCMEYFAGSVFKPPRSI